MLYYLVMQTAGNEGVSFGVPRKLSHAEARREQMLFWSGKTIPERLAAMTALTRRMYEMRGIAYDEQQADFTPSRVRRRQQTQVSEARPGAPERV